VSAAGDPYPPASGVIPHQDLCSEEEQADLKRRLSEVVAWKGQEQTAAEWKARGFPAVARMPAGRYAEAVSFIASIATEPF
jgi:hypothetical protein